MKTRSTLLGLVIGLGLFLLTSAAPGSAKAQTCCTAPPPPCNTCVAPPPPTPPCCTTPPPTPPAACCDTNNKTNVHVNVSNVNVAVATARSSSGFGGNTFGVGGGGDGAFYGGGGGGGGGYSPPVVSGIIQGLNVDASQGGGAERSAYQSSRTSLRRVAIQAVCLDDRTIPHPASQVSPDRAIEDGYEGEIYRCIAGTWLQATIANYDGRLDFSGGQTLTCHKGDALYHGRGGLVQCRPQRPARDCNERSLLRRFGAGIKILTMVTTESFTTYRESASRTESSSASFSSGLSLDGGVGGIVF